jgi:C4-type Zn-finger protein
VGFFTLRIEAHEALLICNTDSIPHFGMPPKTSCQECSYTMNDCKRAAEGTVKIKPPDKHLRFLTAENDT